jgi:uncharacterized protein YfeS
MSSWELSKNTAHPRARQLMADSMFWDIGNEVAPFGNDTGNDVLHDFYRWRKSHQTAQPLDFLSKAVRDAGVDDADWEVTDDISIRRVIANDDDRAAMFVRDESVIALAFGQLVLEGAIDDQLRRRAELALTRQGSAPVLERWGDNAAERRAAIDQMLDVLRALVS